MAKKYTSLITEQGKTLIAAAIAGGDTLKLKYFAVGDGNGASVIPTSDQTALVNEVVRVEINSLKETDATKQVVTAEAIIPAATGGFWMREAGVFTEDGTLIAISQMPETYKPDTDDGAASTQTVRMLLAVSDTSTVNLTIDDTTVIASEDYVNSQLATHEKSRNHPDGTLTDRGFVQLSSATDSDSETLAATPKAVKAANDNADSRLKADKNLSDVESASISRGHLGLGDLATKDSLTASDVGALPTAGGELTGIVKTSAEIQSTSPDNYRIVNGDYGIYWKQDGSDLYIMLTNAGDQYGGYNDFRPIRVNLATGLVYINDVQPYSANNCPFPVGYVMLMGNSADPNGLYPGTTWEFLNNSYDGRVIALGQDPGATGGSNTVTLAEAHMPPHRHNGGSTGDAGIKPDDGAGQWGTGRFGTDKKGDYALMQTSATGGGQAFSVQNEYVHFQGWMRTA